MKIVFYCKENASANIDNYLELGVSGTVSAMILASQGLTKLGHDVVVLNRSESGDYQGTRYLKTNSPEEVARHMEDLGLIDVFIANGSASDIFQQHEIRSGKRAAWIHNFVDHKPYEKAIKDNRLDYIICISNNQLGTWWRSPVFDRIAQIYNAIDIQAIDEIKVRSVKEKKIMFIGAPRASKGFHDALQIFDAFVKRNPGYKFYVAGSAALHFSASALSENGIFERDYEESRLKNLLYCSAGRLRNDVVLLGMIPRVQVLKHLGSSLLALQNPGWDSEPEVHSVSAMEAQAMGVPVISSFRGGQPETIINGQTGNLLKSQNLESAVRILESIVNNPQIIDRMSQRAKRHVSERFRIEIIAQEWNRCLGVMSRGGGFSGNLMKAIRIKLRHKIRR